MEGRDERGSLGAAQEAKKREDMAIKKMMVAKV